MYEKYLLFKYFTAYHRSMDEETLQTDRTPTLDEVLTTLTPQEAYNKGVTDGKLEILNIVSNAITRDAKIGMMGFLMQGE
jgi:hypothetical protein